MTASRRVVFRKPDLDTCLTAVILGVDADWQAVHAPDGAEAADLADPSVLCIEAGGSGEVARGNFDHHGGTGPLAAACEQALATLPHASPPLQRLTAYVAAVDLVRPLPAIEFPSLSSVFSGMRLVVADAVVQFRGGTAMCRNVLEEGLDPFGPMPLRPEWRDFIERRRSEQRALEQDLVGLIPFRTDSGRAAGFIDTSRVGALGALYALGHDIGIARRAHPDAPPGSGAWQYTIGGRDGYRVTPVLSMLTAIEPGWGGPSHGTIVGSPATGSHLSAESVLTVVRKSL